MQEMPLLSILIPVYNRDLRPLLDSLESQLLDQPVGRVELVVVEDGSTESFANRELVSAMGTARYESFAVNRGRAAARNRLLKLARGKWVLFLDADMLPDREDFLAVCLEHCRPGVDIVCGGISYRQCAGSDRRFSFYLYKSTRTEALPAEKRRTAPWRYLFTSNILLRREIVRRIRFDDRFVGYGFEDVEWGIRLGHEYTLQHIDNTCSHMGLMTAMEVYEKMRNSIGNYALLVRMHPLETAGGAVRPARMLSLLPAWILTTVDRMLEVLFRLLHWNPLRFVVFQGNKAVLLARALKSSRSIS